MEETGLARELGIFGSPTFVVGRELFWGDDRLEDAISWYRYGSVRSLTLLDFPSQIVSVGNRGRQRDR